jgi:hypothetical protein
MRAVSACGKTADMHEAFALAGHITCTKPSAELTRAWGRRGEFVWARAAPHAGALSIKVAWETGEHGRRVNTRQTRRTARHHHHRPRAREHHGT